MTNKNQERPFTPYRTEVEDIWVTKEFDHLMYVWAVEMASVWDRRGDLDGYCYWWSWRIEERWDEAERVAYEAWKYEQLSSKFDGSARAMNNERIQARVLRDSSRPLHGLGARPRSRSSMLAVTLASMALAGFKGPDSVTNPMDLTYPLDEPKICTHGFGIAGGFSSCAVCGIKSKKK